MRKVMLVDDEPFVRRGMKLIINWEQYGYEVVAEAGNGTRAIEILEKERIDLVFVDIKMPGMSGLEMMECVRNSVNWRVDFVILTGFADFDYARKAIDLSVKAYLLKPVRRSELVDVLESLNREYKQKRNDRIGQRLIEDGDREEEDTESDRLLQNVVSYVSENYNQNISLKSLGEHFYINNVYLGQIFKRKYGVAFRDYLNRIRIEKAAELLEETDDMIYIIAKKVGFGNADYFVNKFLQEKGITPRKYRVEMQKKGK